MSPSPTEDPMARLPPNLVVLFTQALKTYQLSNATFRVLCSLPSSICTASDNGALSLQPQRTPPKSIFVLDSSFNPPTLAHQRMALSALADNRRHDPSESRVLLLLAINNADKAPKPAVFPQRLAMMYVFAQDLLATASREQDHQRRQENGSPACGGVDIAVTTEPYFHAKSGAIATSDFYDGSGGSHASTPEQVYLTGFDTLIRIFDPKYYPADGMATSLDPFFAHSRLRVTMRTDADWGDADEQRKYLEELRQSKLGEMGGKVEWAEKVEMVDGRRDGEEVVSSTKVREAVKRRDWEALRKLVSEGVTEWIRREGLYGEDAG